MSEKKGRTVVVIGFQRVSPKKSIIPITMLKSPKGGHFADEEWLARWSGMP